MKQLAIISAFLSLLSFTIPAHAAGYSAFCWAQTASGVYCSSIVISSSYLMQGFFCRQFALSQNASASGFFRYTDPAALRLKQEEGCNYVNTKPKYICLLEERCEVGGVVTTSISPTHRYVFSDSGNEDLARKACPKEAPEPYLEALATVPSGCLVGAKAVMTVPVAD
ncbi:MAG: hypothetical protein KGP28_12910 [Bdellovibrionales bacterium]|nr:hypothetical protein [Bdellovibrionales bacterium]